jgi:hypothetical protein
MLRFRFSARALGDAHQRLVEGATIRRKLATAARTHPLALALRARPPLPRKRGPRRVAYAMRPVAAPKDREQDLKARGQRGKTRVLQPAPCRCIDRASPHGEQHHSSATLAHSNG